MMIKNIYRGLACAVILLSACGEGRQEELQVQALQGVEGSALNPYLTRDEKGKAVLCWTEQSASDSLYRLRYATYNERTGSFGVPVTVEPSAGTGTSAESMNKVGFKSDGTVLAMYTRKFTGEKNPWAGAICYSLSLDHGKSWTASRYLHSDTSHRYGRSFFDLAVLRDGELASVWLDGRYGKEDTGSALFFARTRKGAGFGKDSCISRSTCECCRTDLLSSDDGSLHVAFRKILYPAAALGKQVRDMVYMTSADNGKSFGKAILLHADNWKIEGCPHSGPTLAVTRDDVHALWFTGAGKGGLNFVSMKKGQTSFAPLEALTMTGRHPQMVALEDGRLAMAWEEEQSCAGHAMQHTHAAMGHGAMMAAAASGAASIHVSLHDKDGGRTEIRLPSGKEKGHHPVLVTLKNGFLVAWQNEDAGRSGICYTYIGVK